MLSVNPNFPSGHMAYNFGLSECSRVKYDQLQIIIVWILFNIYIFFLYINLNMNLPKGYRYKLTLYKYSFRKSLVYA